MTLPPPATRSVLVISHGFQPAYERGFCNGLVSAGHRVTLVTGERCDRLGLKPQIEVLALRGSQDEGRSAWAKMLNMARYHLALLGRVAGRRHDVVHVIGLIEPLWIVGVLEGLLLRLLARRFVLTVHDLLPHDRHTVAARRACRIAYRMPHALVVHTGRMARELADSFDVARQRITVMAHGLEPLSPSRTVEASVGRLPVRLLCFGHVMPYKGVEVLIDALSHVHTTCTLHVSGTCRDPDLTRRLRACIRSSPASTRITWCEDYVDDDRMRALFEEADAVVLPYRHIDQSGVLMQALRHGTPVVATRVGAFEDHVTLDVGELCDPGSASSLAAAIDRLAARRAAFDRASIRARAANLDWSGVVKALHRAYGARV